MLKKKSQPKINSNVVVRSSQRLGTKFGVTHLFAFILVFVVIGGVFLYKTFAAVPAPYGSGAYGPYNAEIIINTTGLPSGTPVTFYAATPGESIGDCPTDFTVNAPGNPASITCSGYQFGAAGSPADLGIQTLPAGYTLSSATPASQSPPVGSATGLTNTVTCPSGGVLGCALSFSNGVATVTFNFVATSQSQAPAPSSGSGSSSCPYGSSVISGKPVCYTSQIVIKTTGLPSGTPVTFYAATPGESIGDCPTDFTVNAPGNPASITCSGYQFGAAGSPADLGIQTLPAGYTLSSATPASQSPPVGSATGLTNTVTCPSGGVLGCALSFSNGVATVTFNFVATSQSQAPAPSSGSGSSSCPYGSSVISGKPVCYTSQIVIKTTGLPSGTPVTFYAATPGESIGDCPTDFTVNAPGNPASITCSGYQFGAAGSPADLGIQTLPAGYTLSSATPASQSPPVGSATGLTNTVTCPSGGVLGCALSFSNGVATVTFNFVPAPTSSTTSGGSGGSSSSGSCPYGSSVVFGKPVCYTSQVIINVQGVSSVTLKAVNESLGNCPQVFTVNGSITCSGYQFGAAGDGVQLDLDTVMPGGTKLTGWSVAPLIYPAVKGSGLSNAAACSNTGCNFDFSSGQSTVTLVFGPSGDTLHAGEDLPAGGSMFSASGPFGQSSVTVQTAGNLVVKTAAGVALWADRCSSEGDNDYLAMQTDGNLVLYNAENDALWADSTTYSGPGANGAYAQIQNDGNFVVHNGFLSWASNSAPNCTRTGGAGGGVSSNITPAVLADFSTNNNVKAAFDFFTANGYTAAQSAGIVGNLTLESCGLNPEQNSGCGNVGAYNGGGVYGIAQWTPPTGLINWAAAQGQGPTYYETLQAQLLYLQADVGSNVVNNIHSTTTYGDPNSDAVQASSTEAFEGNEQYGGSYNGYERPESEQGSVEDRTQDAAAAYGPYHNDNTAFVPATPGVSKQAGFADITRSYSLVGKK